MSMTSEESLLRYPMTIIEQGKAHKELLMCDFVS